MSYNPPTNATWDWWEQWKSDAERAGFPVEGWMVSSAGPGWQPPVPRSLNADEPDHECGRLTLPCCERTREQTRQTVIKTLLGENDA